MYRSLIAGALVLWTAGAQAQPYAPGGYPPGAPPDGGYLPLPAVRDEPPPPPPPGAGYVWVGGRWGWHHGRYDWIPGRYVIRDARFQGFVPGHWDRRPFGPPVWIPDHWR